MRTVAVKQPAALDPKSSARAAGAREHDASPLLRRTPGVASGDAAGSAPPSGARHDFSRIPVLPGARPRLQAKLAISAPGDRDEVEADAAAEAVMRMPAPGSGEPRLQRAPAASAPSAGAPPVVDEVLRTPGQPLDAATRSFMEPRFGHDFSHVRVHADAKAAESARSVGALAFAVGSHVVFGAGQLAPATEGGSRLMAHELVHVAQQGAAPRLRRQAAPATPAAPAAADPTSEAVRAVQSAVTGLGSSALTADLVKGIERAEQKFLTGMRWVAEQLGMGDTRGPAQLGKAAIDNVDAALPTAVATFAAAFGAAPATWAEKATDANWWRLYAAAILALKINEAVRTFMASDSVEGQVNLGIVMYNGGFASIRDLRREIAAAKKIDRKDVTWQMVEDEVEKRSMAVVTRGGVFIHPEKLRNIVNYVRSVRGKGDLPIKIVASPMPIPM